MIEWYWTLGEILSPADATTYGSVSRNWSTLFST